MENVAHALAGLLVAGGVVSLRSRHKSSVPSARFGAAAAWVSALANNVPDGDLLLTPLTGGKLGYLLHHRGHTHTLLVGILLGLAVALGALAVTQWRRGEPLSSVDRRWILALGALGPIVHIAMDGWNIYGVHPFWPVDNRWYYGDAVFIVEPLLWLAGTPFLFVWARSIAARLALGSIAALGVGLPWLVGSFVPLEARIFVALFGVIAGIAAWRLPRKWSAAAGLAFFFAIPIAFLTASSFAKTAIAARAQADFPGDVLVDTAISAGPANPLCWSAVVTTTAGASELVHRRATLALAPSLVPLDHCPGGTDAITAPLVPIAAKSDGQLRWEGESRVDLVRLRALARDRCDVEALLRFLRSPFLRGRGGPFVLGDLRFDREEELGFGEIELPAELGKCPKNIPPWVPPRASELAPRP